MSERIRTATAMALRDDAVALEDGEQVRAQRIVVDDADTGGDTGLVMLTHMAYFSHR